MGKKISSFMTSKNILIVLTVLCCFFIGTSFFTDTLTRPLKKVVSMVVVPVQKGMNNIGLWVYDKYETLQEISVVLDENKNLQSQVDELTEENNQLKQDTYELSRLRELYQLDSQYTEYSKVGARVIGMTTDNWHSSLKIDKGTDDGIQAGMNVIASGGLVGIISETGSNYSIIKTITENNSNVQGDIELMDTGMIRVTHFKSDVIVRNGDKVVTSNISDKYLQGILIGYVKDVKLDSNNLTQSGYIVPAVDFNNLQEVLVITQLKE